MNARYGRTLTRDKISEWQELRAVCMSCGHSAPIDIDRFPLWDEMLLKEPLLHCMKCGSKGKNMFQVGPKYPM